MMKDIYEKLAVWSGLSKQCRLVQSRLLAVGSVDCQQAQAELLVLKTRTEAAFQDAANAIRSVERARPKGHGLRRAPVPQSGSTSAQMS
jgi:hypothetical protein